MGKWMLILIFALPALEGSVIAADRQGDQISRLLALIPARVTYTHNDEQHVRDFSTERKGKKVKIKDHHRVIENTAAGQRFTEYSTIWVLDFSKIDPQSVTLTTDAAGQILECFTPRMKKSIKRFFLGGTMRMVDAAGAVQESFLNPDVTKEHRFSIRLPHDDVANNEQLAQLFLQVVRKQADAS